MSAYDTDDPCAVGMRTTYVITILNEGTFIITNAKLTNRIPKQMKFIKAEVDAPKNKQANKIEYRYNKEEHQIHFDSIVFLPPGDKVIYKIVCEAIKEGSAKNTAYVIYDQFKKRIIDEEGTSIYKE
ncbi:hypothetical protein [Candidatus Uabimicrobium sp. HlEnr_7]|uniref:hypothetical protein n=1 Tax=Candidatus Uabimicrobium helgolandensis TaxID=3095367 RepID=UPI00355897DB